MYIPEDIQYLILDQLSRDPTQLLRLATISRAWLHHSRGIYCNSYSFCLRVSTLRKPSVALGVLSSPLCTIRGRIRCLDIVGPEVSPTDDIIRPPLHELYERFNDELAHLSDIFPPLHRLSFRFPTWTYWSKSTLELLAKPGKRLRTLEFRSTRFQNWDTPLYFAAKFPNLRKLSISSGRLATSSTPTPSASVDFPSLTWLVVDAAAEGSHTLLRGFLTQFSNLTKLTINEAWLSQNLRHAGELIEFIGPRLRHLEIGVMRLGLARQLEEDLPITLKHNTNLASLEIGPLMLQKDPIPMTWLLELIQSISSESFQQLRLRFILPDCEQRLDRPGPNPEVYRHLFGWSILEQVFLSHEGFQSVPILHIAIRKGGDLDLAAVKEWLPDLHAKGKLTVVRYSG